MDFTRRLSHPDLNGGQYLEDLSCCYWLSESLFTAIGLDLFELLHENSATAEALSEKTGTDCESLCRFLHVLEELKLIGHYDAQDARLYYNTKLAEDYLTKDSPLSQIENILWRKALKADWETLPEVLKAGRRVHFLESPTEEEMEKRRYAYLEAMDSVLTEKIDEILPMLPEKPMKILDLGCGSGLFSRRILRELHEKGFAASATLCDIEQMERITLDLSERQDPKLMEMIRFQAVNLLESDWGLDEHYDLIILSNILHAYADESDGILQHAQDLLTEDGLILMHDFFLESDPLKSALSDVNMMINTYNGHAYSLERLEGQLKDGMQLSPSIDLKGDTAVIFLGRAAALEGLNVSPQDRLIAKLKHLGYDRILPVTTDQIVRSGFTDLKCSYGCTFSGSKNCQTNHDYFKQDNLFDGYSKALLLLGEPPTDDFQRKALLAEADAFKSGFYKAFVFWAGPCSICPNCDKDKACQNPSKHRPSMEGAGIDVFKTLENAGITIVPLREKGEMIRYTALLLLE